MTQRRHLPNDAGSRLKKSLRAFDVYERQASDASSRKLEYNRRISGGTS